MMEVGHYFLQVMGPTSQKNDVSEIWTPAVPDDVIFSKWPPNYEKTRHIS